MRQFTVGKGKGNIGHGGLARERKNGRYGTLMQPVYGLRLGGEKGLQGGGGAHTHGTRNRQE